MGGQVGRDAVGPSEPDLAFIFADRGRFHVIFLVQQSGTGIVASTAAIRRGFVVRERLKAISAKGADRDPLQRCPTVGRVPLAAAVDKRRAKAAGPVQMQRGETGGFSACRALRAPTEGARAKRHWGGEEGTER